MPYFDSPVDGARLFYRDYRPSSKPPAGPAAASDSKPKPAIVFLHGWPMSSKMFDHLALPLSEDHGYRCILPDRRGFGKSDWNGGDYNASNDAIDFDTFADDVISLLTTLHLPVGFVLVGASMGTGEAIRTLSRSAALRASCKGVLFIGTNLPHALKSDANPAAPPQELWDAILAGLRADRAGFVAASLPNVFGAHAGVEVAPSKLARMERIVEDADSLAIERTCRVLSSTDFSDDVRAFGKGKVPLLMLHGDSDQGAPLEAGPEVLRKMVPRAVVKVYEKAAHGLYLTHAEDCLGDIFDFAVQTAG